MEVGSEMLLRPDGTFEYMLAYGAADYGARGSWKVDGDTVVLTSALTEAPPFKLVKSGKFNFLRVTVKAPNGRPIPNIDVIADSDTKARTDQDGVAVFGGLRSAKSVEFEIRVYSFNSGPLAVTDGMNDLTFEINGQAISQVPFKGERLKIAGNCLEMRYWNPDRVMRYCKVK